MRFGPTDKFWVVLDPTPGYEHGEYLLRVSLSDLAFLFEGGLTMARNPTLFTDEKEAKLEAFGRLTKMRLKQAITHQVAEGRVDGIPERLEILDGEGKLLFEADLG